MKNIFPAFCISVGIILCLQASAQCNIDTTNRTDGFSPRTAAVIQPGIAYSQTVQFYLPTTFSTYTIDSVHIDTILGMPAGITYIGSPASQTIPGGGNAAICFSGTTEARPAPYPLTFSGWIYITNDSISLAEVGGVEPKFGYKLEVETEPVASFGVGSAPCAGDSITIDDESTGNPTSWNWQIPGGQPSSSNVQNPEILFDSVGVYPVTLIEKNALGSDTITRNVVIGPQVTANVITLPASGDSAADGSASVQILTGTPPFTYLWSTNATTDTLTDALPGLYFVVATDSNGCQYSTDSVIITFTSGIPPLAISGVSVYPNPATDVLYLVGKLQAETEISVYDLNGQITRTWPANLSGVTALNIQGLAPGTYILRITDKLNGQSQSLKFCVTDSDAR